MKTDKNFKFPSQYKFMLAQIRDPHLRGLWRKSYIQATVASNEHRKGKYIDIFSKHSKGE